MFTKNDNRFCKRLGQILYNLRWYCLVFTVFFFLIWYYCLSQLKLKSPVSGCFCYHYFDHLDCQNNTNLNSLVLFFLNASLLFSYSSGILPRLFFQILFELAKVCQQIFLHFFGYSVNYELLLQASYVVFCHTNISLFDQCQCQLERHFF